MTIERDRAASSLRRLMSPSAIMLNPVPSTFPAGAARPSRWYRICVLPDSIRDVVRIWAAAPCQRKGKGEHSVYLDENAQRRGIGHQRVPAPSTSKLTSVALRGPRSSTDRTDPRRPPAEKSYITHSGARVAAIEARR